MVDRSCSPVVENVDDSLVLRSSVVIGVGTPSEVFGEDPLMVVSVIADVDPGVLVSMGVLSPVERGAVSLSVDFDVFDNDVEVDCIVEIASVVAMIDVTSEKVLVLPVNAVDVSGCGLICTRNISVGLFKP